jgi:hypothetical protein
MVGSLVLEEGSEFCFAWNVDGTEMLVISILQASVARFPRSFQGYP